MSTADPASHPPLWLRIILGRNPKLTLIRLLVLIIGSAVAFKVVLAPIRVTGISMQPTYKDGQVNFVNRLAYKTSAPRRGDVVGIRASDQLQVLYLKRIIGLPGETIAIRAGEVSVDGTPLREPYLQSPRPWSISPTKLADDEYIVIGDNRTMDQENHTFGKVKASDIVGRILW